MSDFILTTFFDSVLNSLYLIFYEISQPKFFSVFSKMDSMSDFILTFIFEFNLKSYINSEIPRS